MTAVCFTVKAKCKWCYGSSCSVIYFVRPYRMQTYHNAYPGGRGGGVRGLLDSVEHSLAAYLLTYLLTYSLAACRVLSQLDRRISLSSPTLSDHREPATTGTTMRPLGTPCDRQDQPETAGTTGIAPKTPHRDHSATSITTPRPMGDTPGLPGRFRDHPDHPATTRTKPQDHNVITPKPLGLPRDH